MARINDIKRFEKTRNRIHDEVECTYNTFHVDGEKYIQMDTYGTTNREFKGQPSQKIQFNKECAYKMIEILKKEFGL